MAGYRRRFPRAKRAFRRFRRRSRRSRRGMFRMVKRINFVIAEKKYFDFAFNMNGQFKSPPNFQDAALTVTPTPALQEGWQNQISLVNPIQQGFIEGQRIGNRIHVKYVQFSLFFFFTNNNSTTSTAGGDNAMIQGMLCRYMLLLDKQPAQTTLPRTNMMDPGHISYGRPNPVAGTYTAYISETGTFRDYNQLRRFKVLVDLQHQSFMTANPPGTGYQAPMSGSHVAQHYVPINRDFTYGGTSNTLNGASNMIDNDVLLQCCPSEINCCAVLGLARVCYTDS